MSKSTKLRWGEVETYKFVKIYLSHEYLWNSEHENYKLKDKRQKAYQAIMKEFMSSTGIRLNESEVRIKIKNLRSTYIQEVAKIRKRSNHNSSYVPTIKWFADWHRCFKHRSKKSLTDDFEHDVSFIYKINNIIPNIVIIKYKQFVLYDTLSNPNIVFIPIYAPFTIVQNIINHLILSGNKNTHRK